MSVDTVQLNYRRYSLALWMTFGCVFLQPALAHAYIGPGLSVGTGIILLLVVGSILFALYATIIFPMRKRKKSQQRDTSEGESSDS